MVKTAYAFRLRAASEYPTPRPSGTMALRLADPDLASLQYSQMGKPYRVSSLRRKVRSRVSTG